jgi:bifunctional oligoribonuclease and PAP phosphatase NrnA
LDSNSYFFTQKIEEKNSFLKALDLSENILITSHQNPDGDAFGSGLGLWNLLKVIYPQKTIRFISPTSYASFLSWMPGVKNLSVYDSEHNDIIKKADMVFCLDFSSLSRIKDMQKPLSENKKAKVVMIDHHEQPENFADFIFWDTKASSTCELVFRLTEDLGLLGEINLEAATCLYTGLLTDTGSFRFSATSSKVHIIVAFLLDLGVNQSEIHRLLFDQNPIERLHLLGFVFKERMNYLPEFRTVYFYLTENDQKNLKVDQGMTEGIVNYGLSVENVALAAIFIEKDGLIKISFRSIHDFSVADLSRQHFGGGGHKNAAGGRSEKSMEETIEKFLTLLPHFKDDILKQPK